MKTFDLNGKQCLVLLEEASDGGMLVNTLLETDKGTFVSYRHWYNDPAAATAEYDKTDDALAQVKADKALSVNVTGSRWVSPMLPVGWVAVPTVPTPEMKAIFGVSVDNAKYAEAIASAPVLEEDITP